MSNPTFELVSPLPPEQCASRLSAVINIPPDGYDRLWNGSGQAAIYGEVGVDRLSIYVKRGGRSVLATVNASIREFATGTRISGRCRMDAEYTVWPWIVLSTAISIGITFYLVVPDEWLSGGIHHFKELLLGSHVVQLLIGVVFFNAITRSWMRHSQTKFEAQFLQDFLVRTLEGQPIPAVP